eukprot:2353418-Pleurochrysis_carterae.AAC.1
MVFSCSDVLSVPHMLKDLFELLHSSSQPANRRATVVESGHPSLTNESCARMIQKMRADGMNSMNTMG